MERIRKALIKSTKLDPNDPVGAIVLKDKFMTQSAPDIRRKEILEIGPATPTEGMLKVSSLVFYNSDPRG